jgi:O-succinylbenzoic acid--CoA ligase
VVAKPCPVLGERVHAFVALKAPGTSAEELAAHCRPLLSDYKVPESFTLSTAPLPRNANGKLLKRELRDAIAAERAAKAGAGP